jgi:hypothetical protein
MHKNYSCVKMRSYTQQIIKKNKQKIKQDKQHITIVFCWNKQKCDLHPQIYKISSTKIKLSIDN